MASKSIHAIKTPLRLEGAQGRSVTTDNALLFINDFLDRKNPALHSVSTEDTELLRSIRDGIEELKDQVQQSENEAEKSRSEDESERKKERVQKQRKREKEPERLKKKAGKSQEHRVEGRGKTKINKGKSRKIKAKIWRK